MTNFGIIEGIALSIAILWSLPWKGIALWKSAKAGHKPWFIAFLLVNTLGLLEISYIFFFSKKGEQKKAELTDKEKTKEE
jgi:methionyl-tRNA synthetase